MPATRFFAMLREGRRLQELERTEHLSDLCDVSSIALGDSKYYTHMKNTYRQRFEFLAGGLPNLLSAKTLKSEPIESGSATARNAMTAIFSSAKRG